MILAMDSPTTALPAHATCPACGVPVTVGYVKCPRCHAPLPVRIARGRASLGYGGTSITERQGAWRGPAVALVLLAIVGVAIAVVVKRSSRAANVVATVPAVAVAPPAAINDSPVAPVVAAHEAAADTTAGKNALALLDRDLREHRMWSTVTAHGVAITVQSSQCGDAAIVGVIDAAASELKAAGFKMLQCAEPAGHVVFDRAY